MSSPPIYETLIIESSKSGLYRVTLNRPEKRNALSKTLWREIGEAFTELGGDGGCRVVLLSGAGLGFCAGVDFAQMMDLANEANSDELDVSRRLHRLRRTLKANQDAFSAIEKCPFPVVAVIHGACLGGAMDIIGACDVRLASADAFFSIKETDLGIINDSGALQRIPKATGNASLLRELAYTARRFSAQEALSIGLLSRVLGSRAELAAAAEALGTAIATQSPVAVAATKASLNFSRDHGVADALHLTEYLQSFTILGEDCKKAALQNATRSKAKPIFAKL